jgi:predicted DCC family thiol-disulfide oxidoreductase YuxK
LSPAGRLRSSIVRRIRSISACLATGEMQHLLTAAPAARYDMADMREEISQADPAAPARVMRPLLVIDGECGLCWAAARLARRLDRGGRFGITAQQSLSDHELVEMGLSRDRCQRRLYAVDVGGRLHGGARAVNSFLWALPIGKVVVGLLYLVPPLLLVQFVIYELVSRHRQTISRRLGLTECSSRI